MADSHSPQLYAFSAIDFVNTEKEKFLSLCSSVNEPLRFIHTSADSTVDSCISAVVWTSLKEGLARFVQAWPFTIEERNEGSYRPKCWDVFNNEK